MSDLRAPAIALLDKKATPEQLDSFVRTVQGLPPRPEGSEPLAAMFGYIEAIEGSKAASESDRPKAFDPKNIDWHNNNCLVSQHFTVGEVTQYDSRRIPQRGSNIEKNVLALASEMDKIREAWGHPIGVTSWYRPPTVNREVGGASQSQHLTGGAADIYPMAGGSDYDFQDWLDQKWQGGMGYGAARGFVHLDLRGGGFGEPSGYIRWTY